MNSFSMPSLRAMFNRDRSSIAQIRAMRAAFMRLSDAELRESASETEELPAWIALAATAAFRVLHRDVDYIVRNGTIEMVDEFKGRIALDRRWPAGLHTAIEAKEGATTKSQGMILGQITLQHLAALYPRICGMTGTAATQSVEFLRLYGLEVETIPTNRPMVRIDHPDVIFPTKAAKELAVVAEVRRAHLRGQPVLVGTASVADSERLSALPADVPHEVLNAHHDEREAAMIARAAECGAVTVSTNMAGRGTDIQLNGQSPPNHRSQEHSIQLQFGAETFGDAVVSAETPITVKVLFPAGSVSCCLPRFRAGVCRAQIMRMHIGTSPKYAAAVKGRKGPSQSLVPTTNAARIKIDIEARTAFASQLSRW
jgi:preprotein translocase subunit SecA